VAGGRNRAGTPSPPFVRHAAAASRERARAFCWVLGTPEQPGPWPGLVLEWHRGPSGWTAHVAHLVDDGGAVHLVVGWLGADRLRPA
jgi:hypothetical protein